MLPAALQVTYGRTLLKDLMWGKKQQYTNKLDLITAETCSSMKAHRQKLLQEFLPRWKTEWTLRRLKCCQQGQFLC